MIGRGWKHKVEVDAEGAAVEKKVKPDGVEKKEEETGQRVIIEHWRNAESVREALAASHPELCVVLNPQKPRWNSFEVTLMQGDEEVLLWSGIKKGPPCKLNFPDPAEVVTALEEALESK
ncbi:selenoprotein H-like [Myxocyprinus asiaticus]|uniref:selenoprotein H-like n=1 Tax=Myxocyprinus asiaticus TaxID=70543 RepID=UPI002222C4EA|nr:selenoprotein H-like [Myxocyprinus asiaticus]